MIRRIIQFPEWNTYLRDYFGDGLNYAEEEGPAGGMLKPFDIFDDDWLHTAHGFDHVTVWDGVLLPGDTVYVPSGGAHAALNMEPDDDSPLGLSIAVTVRFGLHIRLRSIASIFFHFHLFLDRLISLTRLTVTRSVTFTASP